MKNPYKFIVNGIIPATQLAFKKTGVDFWTRKKESEGIRKFKEVVSNHILENKPGSLFPTSKAVFVAIVQFFTSKKKDYEIRDVDNMAKTILDILQQNKFYQDDSQVRTLFVTKRIDLKRVPQNLGFVYIEVLEDGEDLPISENLIKEALVLYDDLKTRNVTIQ